ncbi:ATP-binding protein [Citrobacter freundii]|uniref:sensor histidine kinase n=1 Tax=Citrobacter freundii TaxID=546 RepID=UPI001C8B533E|nr:ATP-binding protein [Citrobacter freundii]MBX8903371.1 sensor histidine kinase [Citrobacter freundii]MEB0320097.1 ATP-binding protein [Citrobacter freundii]MEB0343440.1 ATP-binding protein [Citrobacter freundii]MEB0372531.1 ATP-binding protein [Citrobacter freundii]MEB0376574.1 ATP-binding protein [Citrobacter freundii]
MNNLSPFVTWDLKENKSHDGLLFSVPTICKATKNKICCRYYNEIADKKGFHTCPKGLSSYSTGNKEQPIYSSFKVAGYYNVPLTKRMTDFLPTLPVISVIHAVSKEYELKQALLQKKPTTTTNTEESDKELIDFSIHEVRKFNGEIKRISEEIMGSRDMSPELLKAKVKSIFASSSLISVRLGVYDIEENPQLLEFQKTYSAGVYKKFQKASHCLENYAKDNKVKIVGFHGKSHHEIEIFPLFDFVPFVILENAIKYSLPNQDIEVHFDEISKNNLEVSVISTGPHNTKEEISRIFDKKSRGSNAILADNTGGGYGLYFAKLVCDLHDIKIKVYSAPPSLKYNGIDYSEFKVVLTINI